VTQENKSTKLKTEKADLTIIVPTYNEEDCLPKFRDEMDRFLLNSTIKAQVLFVNDGSNDNSWKIIQCICQAGSPYHAISLQRNCGLSTALKAGIDYCDTALIGYMDADLQTIAEDFLTLLPFFPEYDLVLGIRRHRQDSSIKKLSSKIASTVRQAILKDGIEDTGCPLKIIKYKYAQAIPFFVGMHRFLPALVQFMGGRVKQVPVRHFPRFGGTPKYHLGNRLIGPFLDTLAVYWMKKRFCLYKIEGKI
jgi:glycosyltransferase involved in cell wall biosynthesis